MERTFLIYYGDANSRLKVTEAFQDIVPTLKITGTDVTYSYSADMNKYIDFYAEQNKDKYPTKEEATAILLGVREKKFESFKHQTGTFDNNTKVLTATLNDGVLNEKQKRSYSLKFQTSLEFYLFILILQTYQLLITTN
ncbi:MAG: hypothetical protein ACLT64_11650 [Streptococcus salivarius]